MRNRYKINEWNFNIFNASPVYATVSEDFKHQQQQRQRPFSPSVPAEAGSLFAIAAGVHVFNSGESLHCFLVGVQIKVML